MLNLVKSFFYQKKGAISIEFSVVLPFLILLFLFSMEFARIMFIGSSIDLLSAEISRKTAISENQTVDYSDQFYQTLSDEVSIWPLLTSQSDFKVTLEYCQDVNAVIVGNCNASRGSDDKLLFFSIEYNYFAIFSQLFSSIVDSSLKKKVIIYREF